MVAVTRTWEKPLLSSGSPISQNKQENRQKKFWLNFIVWFSHDPTTERCIIPKSTAIVSVIKTMDFALETVTGAKAYQVYQDTMDIGE